MRRIQLEPWAPYDKLSLASAVFKTGDQNWNAVARATRNIFEDSTKYWLEDKRSSEWFSNKQCAVQYEALLKNIGPRRKKKTDKTGVEHVGDSANDIIINTVKQECVDELKRSLASTQALYLKLHKEYEDIQAGKLDHLLEDMLEEYEAKEREKEIKLKLKFKIGEKNSEIIENNVSVKVEDNEIKKPPEKEVPVSEPSKTNLTTSPLLTSLLQSPSPLTRPSLPANTSPTISILLNSSPSVPPTDSPTLTKLLEATNTVIGSPLALNSSPQVPSKSEIITPSLSTVSSSSIVTTTTVTSSTAVTSQIPLAVSQPSNDAPPSSPLPSVPAPISPINQPSTVVELATNDDNVIDSNASINSTSLSTPIPGPTTLTPSPELEKPVIVPAVLEEDAQNKEELNTKTEEASEKLKDEVEDKRNEEIEIVQPTTPEAVLEDLVHSVVESEVVIDQDTPTSKRKFSVRKLRDEMVEAEDEVMETVEEIIEKVEEAIIETVGQESAEIDSTLNQSSETDNLSDNIETLDLDSDAVELIVLGPNQRKCITIRHDTEIANEAVVIKTEPCDDEVPVQDLDSSADVDDIVDEEVISASEEKMTAAEVLVDDTGEEIKLTEEIAHEEVVEDKEVEELEENEGGSIASSNTEADEFRSLNQTIKTEANEELSLEDESKESSYKEEEAVEMNLDKPSCSSIEEITEDPLLIEEEGDMTDLDTVITPEGRVNKLKEFCFQVKEDNNDDVFVSNEVIEIVEEAPEEVVVSQVLQEDVLVKIKSDDVTPVEATHGISVIAEAAVNVTIKVEHEDDEEQVSVAADRVYGVHVEGVEGTINIASEDSARSVMEREIASPKPVIKKEETKSRGRKPRVTEETPALPSIADTRRNIKTEKDIAVLKTPKSAPPIQEPTRRRGGRNRSSLVSGDSKPNSPAPSSHSMEDDRDYKAWKKSIMLVYNRLAAHKYASVFLKPITEAEATGYRNVVLKPMDLYTIKRNIETGVIRSTVEFQRDMILLAQNAMVYNKTDSVIFKMAEDMLADMMSQMEVMIQALGDGVPLWGDRDEKLNTRGRASKLQLDEASGAKRRSQVLDETPVRRRHQLQTEDSAKKRKLHQDDSYKKKTLEDKKKLSEDNVKRKSSEESTSKKRSLIDETNIKKEKKGLEESSSSKKRLLDDGVAKRKTGDDGPAVSKKKSDDSGVGKKQAADETPNSSKRRQQAESRKSEPSTNKRKSQTEESSSNKKNDTPAGKRKAAPNEDTPSNKRKRTSAVLDETRSGSKRK